jgi:hypothetical protein
VAYAVSWDWWTRAGVRVATVAVAGLATLAFGLVLFRAYGIGSVYQPTIDFIRTHTRYHGPLKSPSPTWLFDLTWLYGPPILLAVIVIAPGLRRAFMADRTRVTIVGLLAVQTASQWLDQLLRDGSSLELSYYWSYIYLFFVIALAAVIGLDRLLGWRGAAVFVGVWYVALARPAWTGVTLPTGWTFLL